MGCNGVTPAQPAPSVTGAFTGGDGGVTSTTDAVTSQDTLAVGEVQATGVKAVTLGLGIVTLQ